MVGGFNPSQYFSSTSFSQIGWVGWNRMESKKKRQLQLPIKSCKNHLVPIQSYPVQAALLSRRRMVSCTAFGPKSSCLWRHSCHPRMGRATRCSRTEWGVFRSKNWFHKFKPTPEIENCKKRPQTPKPDKKTSTIPCTCLFYRAFKQRNIHGSSPLVEGLCEFENNQPPIYPILSSGDIIS